MTIEEKWIKVYAYRIGYIHDMDNKDIGAAFRCVIKYLKEGIEPVGLSDSAIRLYEDLKKGITQRRRII